MNNTNPNIENPSELKNHRKHWEHDTDQEQRKQRHNSET